MIDDDSHYDDETDLTKIGWLCKYPGWFCMDMMMVIYTMMMLKMFIVAITKIGWLCEWPGWGMVGRGAPHPPLGVT